MESLIQFAIFIYSRTSIILNFRVFDFCFFLPKGIKLVAILLLRFFFVSILKKLLELITVIFMTNYWKSFRFFKIKKTELHLNILCPKKYFAILSGLGKDNQFYFCTLWIDSARRIALSIWFLILKLIFHFVLKFNFWIPFLWMVWKCLSCSY